MTTPRPHASSTDEHLPAIMRWLTRLFSSWWFVAALAGLIGLYLLASYVPLGGRYLWQARLIDVPQQTMLRGAPLHLLLMLLGCTLLWTTIRRVRLFFRAAGIYLALGGLLITLMGLSLHWRFSVDGLIPVHAADLPGQPPSTRYLDPARRELRIQARSAVTFSISIDQLPLWNDAVAQETLTIDLLAQGQLAQSLDYATRVTIVGYVADGVLEADPETGLLQPRPTPHDQRTTNNLQAPPRALLAVQFETQDDAGQSIQTVVWLPFDPAQGTRITPAKAYDIPGLGKVRLAFTLASEDQGFALSVSPHDARPDTLNLQITEVDAATGRVSPPISRQTGPDKPVYFTPSRPSGAMRQIRMQPIETGQPAMPVMLSLHGPVGLELINSGLALAVLGAVLTLLLKPWREPLRDAVKTDEK